MADRAHRDAFEPLPAAIGDLADGLMRKIEARMKERAEFRESLVTFLASARDHEVQFTTIGEVGSPEDAEILKEIREGYRHYHRAVQLLKGAQS